MDAMGTADAYRVLEFGRAALQHLTEFVQVIQDELCGFFHHDTKRCILHIAGGQSLMDVFGILAHVFSHIREECDDIVVGYFLDFLYSRKVKFRFFTDVDSRFLRNLAQLSHSLTGSDFHLQHGLKLVLECPDIAHLGIGIAFDHR